MLYELRIYYMHPGKMEAINDRFANFTLDIFAKNGMKVTEFWQELDTEQNRLFYLMEFPDRAVRDTQFDAFRSDPEWIKARDESELNGLIVERVESVFLKRAPYFKKE
jgi:hypothetical protein